mgnify:CR=1 FL=1
MNELFPIIRRKRRPLLPVESLHDLPPVPVAVTAQKPAEAVITEEKSKPHVDENAAQSEP